MIAKKIWVLVADGKRGRLFKYLDPLVGLERALDHNFSHELPPNHEQGTDRPGKGHESANAAHHAVAPRVDWHREDKRHFAVELARVLEEHAEQEDFDLFVLVAPPQALGDLRVALRKHTRTKLSGELAKDYTELPAKEIEARLKEEQLL